jgi:hypothetical protein
MHAKVKSSTQEKHREDNRGLLLDSSRPVAPQKSEKYPPRYGAQQRQDALWEGERTCCGINQLTQYQAGGNEALPPAWAESKVEGDGRPVYYWDGAIFMHTKHRPLPGVRLGKSESGMRARHSQ